MDNYDIYRGLASEIEEKKLRLSALNSKLKEIKIDIAELEAIIEEDKNGLIMVFDYLIAS